MKVKVEIARNCSKWTKYKDINSSLIKKIAIGTLENIEPFKNIKQIEISLLLTNDVEMKNLNTEFRNKNSTTNVLSFPDIELNWKHLLEFKPNLIYMYLGDIAFSIDTLIEESKNYDVALNDHFIHLMIHSILHLIGYDHEENEEKIAMQNLENEILKKFTNYIPN